MLTPSKISWGFARVLRGHWDLQEHLLRLQKPLATLSCSNSSAVQIPGESPGGSALGQGGQRPSFPPPLSMERNLWPLSQTTCVHVLSAKELGSVKSDFSCSGQLELIKLFPGDGTWSLSFQEPDTGSMKIRGLPLHRHIYLVGWGCSWRGCCRCPLWLCTSRGSGVGTRLHLRRGR